VTLSFRDHAATAALRAADDLPDALRVAGGDPDPSAQRTPLRRVAPEHGGLERLVGGDANRHVILQLETALGEIALPGRALGYIFCGVRKLLVQEDVTGFPSGQDKARLGHETMIGMPKSQRDHPGCGGRRRTARRQGHRNRVRQFFIGEPSVPVALVPSS
jgi:hypothetical protein